MLFYISSMSLTTRHTLTAGNCFMPDRLAIQVFRPAGISVPLVLTDMQQLQLILIRTACSPRMALTTLSLNLNGLAVEATIVFVPSVVAPVYFRKPSYHSGVGS